MRKDRILKQKIKRLILLSFICIFWSCQEKQQKSNLESTYKKEQQMTLQSQLEAKKQQYVDNWSTETLAMHENGIDVVNAIGITSKAIQLGE